jgi:hypothetical protein
MNATKIISKLQQNTNLVVDTKNKTIKILNKIKLSITTWCYIDFIKDIGYKTNEHE